MPVAILKKIREHRQHYVSQFPLATVDPNGKFLYSIDGTNRIDGYAINATTGALTPIAGSPFGAGSGAVAVAPNGKFAYTFAGGGLLAYAIDQGTGALSAADNTSTPRNGREAALCSHFPSMPQRAP
jgi:6-phosphogluconolactonase (cycloisomerase 2 family)